MGQDASSIRAQIEETRMRVGDEVDALSYKTDVPARVGDYVDGKKQVVVGKIADVKDAMTGATSTMLPSGEKVSRLKDTAERNPLGLAIGGAAVGFVAGLLLPSTKLENEKLGEASDRIGEAVKDTAGEAIQSGKQVASETVDRAIEQGQDLASTLQDKTRESLTGAGASTDE